MTRMRQWLRLSSTAEHAELAELAGTSVGNLRQLSNVGRSASPDLARRIEYAACSLREINGRLPELLRVDLSPVCRTCEYARLALGEDRIIQAEFDHLVPGQPKPVKDEPDAENNDDLL